MDDSGFPEDTRQSFYVHGNICINVKGHRTVTGACGPYNLGGSATMMMLLHAHLMVIMMDHARAMRDVSSSSPTTSHCFMSQGDTKV